MSRLGSLVPKGACQLRLALFGDTHVEPTAEPAPRSNARTAAIIERINHGDFDAAVHLGDVIHPLPSMPEAESAWQAAGDLLARLSPPLHTVPGNHDIGDKPLKWLPAKAVRGDWVRSFETRFGPSCRSVDIAGIRLLLLNAPLLNSRTDEEAEQWQRLEELLAETRRLIVFLHYPPFLLQADEASNYDNLDEPARSRLLGLLSASGCEALFCGHVHHRFYNRHGGMEIYTVPSTSFTRRDYVETHPLAPEAAHEYGRNLASKLGFLELSIHEHGHQTRFIRLDGDFESQSRGHRLGVDLRHPWCEVGALPYNPPTDAFQRRRVRDDRAVLALLDLGIRRARIPIDDLLDPAIRERAGHLADRGMRWTVFCLGEPSVDAERILAEASWMIEAVECIDDVAPPSLRRPVVLAPLITSHDSVSGKANLTQFTGWGLSLEELMARPASLPSGVEGYVLDLPWHAPFAETAKAALWLTEERRWSLHVTVGLMAGRPDLAILDDRLIVARVQEAVALAERSPRLRIFLDTFEDVDRGYFVRRGLIDRRGDPTPAGLALVNAAPSAATRSAQS